MLFCDILNYVMGKTSSIINAILRHTPVDPVHFTGVGRADGLQCNALNMPHFQVTIDAQDIWYSVPVAAVKNIPRQNFNMDLFEVLAFLRDEEWSV
jgi:hypothetical protein